MQYTKLINQILSEGTYVTNKRTKATCLSISGAQLQFTVTNYFPALTLRKVPFKSTVAELIGFFRGYTSAKDFRDLGCKFWDANANETEAWLKNFYRKGEDDLGNIYGKQWTDWTNLRLSSSKEEDNYLRSNGWEYLGVLDAPPTKGHRKCLYRKRFNQLENVVKTILTDPSDRRIMVSGWNVGDLDQMALPPCHVNYLFIPNETTRMLDVVMFQRSCDVYLGLPANIMSTTAFLYVVARLTGYTPNTITIQLGNAHLYENSIDAAKELVLRSPYPYPKLQLSESIKEIVNLSEVEGCFNKIQPNDFEMVGYKSHDVLSVPMIA